MVGAGGGPAGQHAAPVQHGNSRSDVPQRDSEIDPSVDDLDARSLTWSGDTDAVDEARPQRRIARRRLDEQRPKLREQGELGRPGRAIPRPDGSVGEAQRASLGHHRRSDLSGQCDQPRGRHRCPRRDSEHHR